jgi:hypothetical protein
VEVLSTAAAGVFTLIFLVGDLGDFFYLSFDFDVVLSLLTIRGFLSRFLANSLSCNCLICGCVIFTIALLVAISVGISLRVVKDYRPI